MLIRKGCLLIASLILFSCDDSDSDNVERIVENDRDLIGSWDGACTSFDKLGLTGVQSKYEFGVDGNFEKSEQFFASDDCSGAAIEYRLVGDFDTSDRDNVPDSISYTIQESFLNLQSESVVKLANTVKLCGRSDWQVGERQEVTGADCEEVLSAKAGDQLQDIYQIDGDELFFGETLFFSLTGDKEPESVNANVKYTKN